MLIERVFLFFEPSLDRLGMNVAVRTVDNTVYSWGWVNLKDGLRCCTNID